jgi:FkbM family methyltransferase
MSFGQNRCFVSSALRTRHARAIEKMMSLLNKIKKLAEQLTNTRIYRRLPRGVDFIYDIANSLPVYHAEIVFDVGANAGQSAGIYLARFPDSHIYCFEPASTTFRQLRENLKNNDRVDFYQLALGSSKGKGNMVLQGIPEMFFLSGQSKESPGGGEVTTESVDVVSMDEFCQTKGIDHIDYLKIDTEGGDLEVLKGAVNLLAGQRIDLVQVEAGMNPGNKRHVPFETLQEFLNSHDYFLFGIYEQVREWPTREPHLRRINAIYISHRMIEMNRKLPKAPTNR